MISHETICSNLLMTILCYLIDINNLNARIMFVDQKYVKSLNALSTIIKTSSKILKKWTVKFFTITVMYAVMYGVSF